MMHRNANVDDPATNSIKYMLRTRFSLISYKSKKRGSSELVRVHYTAPCHNKFGDPAIKYMLWTSVSFDLQKVSDSDLIMERDTASSKMYYNTIFL